MRIVIALIMTSLLILAVSGCNNLGGGANKPVKLTAGNTWTYKVSNELLDPRIPSNFKHNNGTKTRVMGAATNKGTPATDNEKLAHGEPVTATYYFNYASNGDLMMGDSDNPSSLYLPANPAVGKTWTSGGATFKITSTTGTVTVPAGTFNDCIQVDFEGAGIDKGTWMFSPSAGSYVYHKTANQFAIHIEELEAGYIAK
jgi:hypothetical protein